KRYPAMQSYKPLHKVVTLERFIAVRHMARLNCRSDRIRDAIADNRLKFNLRIGLQDELFSRFGNMLVGDQLSGSLGQPVPGKTSTALRRIADADHLNVIGNKIH